VPDYNKGNYVYLFKRCNHGWPKESELEVYHFGLLVAIVEPAVILARPVISPSGSTVVLARLMIVFN